MRKKLYNSFRKMKDRCYNKNAKDYPDYGGRGISVCEKWRTDFNTFAADMGPKPSSKHSLDRIDVNGNYEPTNCRWATNKEQQLNKRNNVLITSGDLTLTQSQWADKIGVTPSTIAGRIKGGKSVEKCLSYRCRPLVEYDGKQLPIGEWAKLYRIKADVIWKRLWRGWTPEEAITTPVISGQKIQKLRNRKGNENNVSIDS